MNEFLREELARILEEGNKGIGELASVVNLAAMQLDNALPTIRAGAEALGDTDLGRTMWMVAHHLGDLHRKLEEAEMAGDRQ